MEAVLLIGIQGSGKSTFYCRRFAGTHARINLDVLKTRDRERVTLQSCLASGQPFVVDNTNVRAAERAVYIAAARRAGFRVIGYYFEVNLRDALRRNAQRTGTANIPVAGIIGTLKRLEAPRLAEGFDELYQVTRDEADQFVVAPWMGTEGQANA